MKTLEDLEQVVRTILCDVGYIGKIVIEENLTSDKQHLGYTLKLGLNTPDQPFSISCEGDSEFFINFVKSELKKANLHSIEFFKGMKVYDEGYYNRPCR